MKFSWKNIRTSLLIAAAILIVAIGAVVAQQQGAATDTGVFGTQPSAGVSGQPDGTTTSPNSALSGPAGSDTGVYDTGKGDAATGPAPDDNPAPGATSSRQGVSPSAVSTTFSYYQVSGATLRGRSSTTAYAYDSVGCVHLTAGAGIGLILNTEAHIPDNAVIKYIRLYYSDASATGTVSAFLTRYTPGSLTSDLVSVASTAAFSGGYGFVVSSELFEVVNNGNYAYTLIGWPSGPDVNLQICGIRVAYYAPLTAVAFLPNIMK